jgi:hypothetical protein
MLWRLLRPEPCWLLSIASLEHLPKRLPGFSIWICANALESNDDRDAF